MSFRPRRVLPALAIIAASLIAGCSSGDSGTAPIPPVTGPTWSFAFPGAGAPGAPGTSNKRVFTEIGVWTYHCAAHPTIMTGTITVVDSTDATAVDSVVVKLTGNSLGSLSFNSAAVKIKQAASSTDPRRYVRWSNESSFTNHTSSRP